MGKIEISIIIPVHNAEKYIKHTLQSILNQRFSDFEIIVVDDFSADTTVEIVRNFLNNDARIRLIKQNENSGVSAARNVGIDKAKGEYIEFIDGDDFLSKEALIKIHRELIERPDTLLINYNITDEDFKIFDKSAMRFSEEQYPNKETSGIEALRLLFSGKISHWPFDFIVKRQVLIENEIQFPIGRNYGEDFATMYKILFYSKKVSFLSEKIYYYVQHDDSVSHNHKVTDSVNYYDTILEIDNFVQEKIPELSMIKNDYLLPRLINAYSILCKFPYQSDDNFKEKIKNEIIVRKASITSLSRRDQKKFWLIRLHLLDFMYRCRLKFGEKNDTK